MHRLRGLLPQNFHDFSFPQIIISLQSWSKKEKVLVFKLH